jgi:hypothetical protein
MITKMKVKRRMTKEVFISAMMISNTNEGVLRV